MYFQWKMVRIHFLLLIKANACIFVHFLVYLDKKNVQLYFATQFGRLSAKFAPENAPQKVDFNDLCKFSLF